MVKKYTEDLRKEQLYNEEKVIQKAQQLALLRKRDFILDRKKAALRQKKQYHKVSPTVYDFLFHTAKTESPQIDKQENKDVQLEVYSYKVAKQNCETVLKKVQMLKMKNERPPDYLVEMYKSDKQMFKVRRYLTDKEEKIKQKMQGHDWMSKNKRKQRAKKKAEAKKAKKKAKIQSKKPLKQKMDKVNGKKKVKK